MGNYQPSTLDGRPSERVMRLLYLCYQRKTCYDHKSTHPRLAILELEQLATYDIGEEALVKVVNNKHHHEGREGVGSRNARDPLHCDFPHR